MSLISQDCDILFEMCFCDSNFQLNNIYFTKWQLRVITYSLR